MHHGKRLLQREITRKEFLGLMGAGLASLVGIDRLIQLLEPHSQRVGNNGSDTYGGGAYGGPHDHPRQIGAARGSRRTG